MTVVYTKLVIVTLTFSMCLPILHPGLPPLPLSLPSPPLLTLLSVSVSPSSFFSSSSSLFRLCVFDFGGGVVSPPPLMSSTVNPSNSIPAMFYNIKVKCTAIALLIKLKQLTAGSPIKAHDNRVVLIFTYVLGFPAHGLPSYTYTMTVI